MTNKPHTETIELVTALAEFDPAFLAVLDKSLQSWISKNTKGPASLGWMQSFCDKGYRSELRGLLSRLPSANLKAFASKVDKFHPTLSEFSTDEKIDHIYKLISGERDPAPKPKTTPRAKAPKKTPSDSTPRLSLNEIINLDDERQGKELSRLSDPELKRQARDIGMDVPAHLKKAQRIRFIQEELAAGWPKPRSVLDSSRY